MQTLCPITDWQESEVTRGRGKGNKNTTRVSIAGDNWNWMTCLEKQGSTQPPIGQQFFGSIRLLALGIEGFDLAEVLPKVAKSLSERTGTVIEIPDCKTKADWVAFAVKIDATFGTSYAKAGNDGPQIYRRIFKDEEKE